MKKILSRASAAALAGLLLAFAGCASVPPDALKLAESSDRTRELQTHHFNDVSERTLLAASAAVLQDLGFTLEESESELGVLSASRQLTSRRPPTGGEIAKDLAWGLVWLPLGATLTAIDAAKGVKEPQRVRVSLVTRRRGPTAAGSSVRVTAQRIVYKDERLTKILAIEPLDDALFYREFFARLEKSVFLETQKP